MLLDGPSCAQLGTDRGYGDILSGMEFRFRRGHIPRNTRVVA